MKYLQIYPTINLIKTHTKEEKSIFNINTINVIDSFYTNHQITPLPPTSFSKYLETAATWEYHTFHIIYIITLISIIL